MRSKISIMNGRQDITDEELERFKNFDTVLNRHYRILNEKKPFTWKIVVPVTVLVISVVFYWVSNNTDSKPVKNETLFSADSVTLQHKKKGDPAELPGSKKGKSESTSREKRAAVITDTQNTRPAGEQAIDSRISKEAEPATTPAVLQPNPDSVNSTKTETVYVQAEPVEGYEALYAYFGSELIYPEAAVKDSVEGVLIVKFLINKEGRPEQIQISGSLGNLFEKEAVRLIEHMPLWKPATLNGKAVTSKLSIPLTFQLQKK